MDTSEQSVSPAPIIMNNLRKWGEIGGGRGHGEGMSRNWPSMFFSFFSSTLEVLLKSSRITSTTPWFLLTVRITQKTPRDWNTQWRFHNERDIISPTVPDISSLSSFEKTSYSGYESSAVREKRWVKPLRLHEWIHSFIRCSHELFYRPTWRSHSWGGSVIMPRILSK